MPACSPWIVFAARTLLTVFALLVAAPLDAQEKTGPKLNYEEHVQPLLRAKCFACHNPNKKSGGLDMTTYSNLLQGGASGEVINPGSAADSYLYMLVTHESEPYMPPESPKLPEDHLALLREWIDSGALENAGSKPLPSRKPKVSLALGDVNQGRPEEPAMPGRLVLEPVVHTERTTAVPSLATSPWAPLAALASPQQVLLYHTQSLQLLGALPFPEGMPRVLKFSRNGQLLLAGGGRGGASGKVVVWSVATGERVMQVGDELDEVLGADLSADQALVALGGPQRLVRIYSTSDGKLLHELKKHTDWITAMEFSPDGVLLATADRNGGVMVWESHTGREYLTLNGHTASVSTLSWRADSNILATGSEDGTVRLWEMENGGQVKNWGAHGGVASLEFARDGRILTTGRDQTARLWDQNGQQLAACSGLGDIGVSTTLCDETNRALVADWLGDVQVFNAADGQLLGRLTPNPPPLAQRLEAAQQQLSSALAAHQPAAAALEQAAAALASAQQMLQQTQNAITTNQQQLDQLAAAQEKTISALAASKQQGEQASKRVDLLAKSAPLLADAAHKAQQAAAVESEDATLKALADQLQQSATQKAALLSESQTLVQTSRQEMAELEALLKEQAAKLVAARELQTRLPMQLEQAATMLETAAQGHAQVKAAAEVTAATLAAAQHEVDQWTEAIAFRDLMQQLQKERLTAQQDWEAKAQDQAAASAMLVQSQQALAAAEQEHTQVVQALEARQVNQAKAAADLAQISLRLEALKQQRAAEAEVAMRLSEAVQALQSAEANTRQALEKSPEDAELKAITESVQKLVAQKSESAKSQAEKIAAVDAQLQTSATERDAGLQAVEKSKSEVEAMQQRVVESQKAQETLQAAVDQKQQAAQAATSAAEQASQAIDQLEQKIAAARQS